MFTECPLSTLEEDLKIIFTMIKGRGFLFSLIMGTVKKKLDNNLQMRSLMVKNYTIAVLMVICLDKASSFLTLDIMKAANEQSNNISQTS